MKPEDPVFIYNPLETDGFYGSRKCEVVFFPKELLIYKDSPTPLKVFLL